MAQLDPTGRFSSRAADYLRWRPGYPREVIELLCERCSLGAASLLADLGSGTGIFTRLLLETGAQVYAVEPNAEMRREAEAALARFPNFHSVAAPAESTGLAEHSIDLIAAAQAAHWFEVGKARAEFRRIAKPDGWLALIWNTRRTAGTPFLCGYESLLQRYAPNYAQISANQDSADRVAALFAPAAFSRRVFDNRQHFDWEGLAGRARSSSYVRPDTPTTSQCSPNYVLCTTATTSKAA